MIIMQVLDKKTKQKYCITAMDILTIPIASFGEGAFFHTVVINQL